MVNLKHSTRALVAPCVVFLLGACQPSIEEPEIVDTVDVEPSLSITPDEDQTAVARAPELVGILPADFPTDLPLFLPASLVDFGTNEGARYVSLLTATSLQRVDRELAALLRQKGWSVSDAAGGKRLRKGSQQVTLRLENARPGTLFHYEY